MDASRDRTIEKALDKLERAFDTTAFGDAHEHLAKYVRECWSKCVDSPKAYYPYIAIVQSSGFGKSRLLREYARICSQHNIVHDAIPRERFHLLYVGACDTASTRGVPRRNNVPAAFPVPTTELREYLFPRDNEQVSTNALVRDLATKLFKLFAIAYNDADDRLDKLFSRDAAAQDYFCNPPPYPVVNEAPQERTVHVLVIAIDEARALLPTQSHTSNNTGWFLGFRRALCAANDEIRRLCGEGFGLFGIVTDTNSRISNFAPPAPSQPTGPALFPPFELTNTVDVFFNKDREKTIDEKEQCYKQRVLSAVMFKKEQLSTGQDGASAVVLAQDTASFDGLCELGRPLWGSREWTRNELVDIAASKLLGSSLPSEMQWTPCLMCRASVRPYKSTPIATEFVADGMAVLVYVTEARDRFFVTYSSDPILTIGATKAWYSVEDDYSQQGVEMVDRGQRSAGESNLSKYILPQFIAMLNQEVLDTGGIGEFVARVVLLLVMDACAVLETGEKTMRWQGAGNFYSVVTFLQALEGTDLKVRKRRNVTTKTLEQVYDAMETKWGDWFVSFTHFVQLSEEPTETCLWGLLGRRAAAIMPQGQNGADLVIPMCHLTPSPNDAQASSSDVAAAEPQTLDGKVSMILVQVKNHKHGFSSYVEAVTEGLDPTFVFSDENPLRNTPQDDVLRVLLSLRSKSRPQHAYVEDTRHLKSYALCMFGLGAWSSRLSGKEPLVEVVSSAMAEQLNSVLGPFWSVSDAVADDLKTSTTRSSDEFVARALKPLAATLVLNTRRSDQERRQVAAPDNTGGNTVVSTETATRTLRPQARRSTVTRERHPTPRQKRRPDNDLSKPTAKRRRFNDA